MANSFSNLGATPNNTSTPQTKGLLPLSYSPNSGGMSTQPTSSPAYSSKGTPNFSPSTPVKSITSPTGSITTFHAPAKSTAKTPTASATNDVRDSQGLLVNPVGAQFDRNTGQALGTSQGLLNKSPYVQSPSSTTNTPAPQYTASTPNLYGQVTANLANMGTQPSEAYTRSQEEVARINDQLNQSRQLQAQGKQDILNQAIPLEFQTGQANNLTNKYLEQQSALGQQLSSAQAQVGQANTQQGLQQGALQQAGNLSAPQAYSPTQTPYNPVTNSFNGQNQMDRAIGGANIQSAQELTNQSNTLKSVLNGADANFRLLIDTAKQGGVNDTNVPALNILTQNIQKGLASSSAVTNFRSTLAAVRNQYANILGGGAATDMSRGIAAEQIPDNISLGALQSLYTQMQSEANNRIVGIDNQIKDLSKNQTQVSSSNQSGGGTMFGSFFSK